MAWVDRATWWDDYRAYLDSPQWHAFRERALRHYGERCNRCKRRRSQLLQGEWLEVDHLHYRTVGHEQLGDVQILCNTCHGKKTRSTRRRRTVRRFLGV